MSDKHSISGYTKIYNINQLSKSFSKGDYDSACFWSVEMHMSGWIDHWWVAVTNYCALNIHLCNPKIGKFLYKICSDYPGLTGKGDVNANNIRQSIALVSGVITFSKKDVEWTIPKPITIPVREEVSVLNEITLTTTNHSALRASLKGDPQFMIKLMSKMANCIESTDFYGAIRVLSIGLFLDKHKLYKKKIKCCLRCWNGLDKRHWDSWLLFVWDVLMAISLRKNMNEIVGSWRAMYIANCSICQIKTLMSYIVSCIGLLSHNVNLNIKCVQNEHTINKGCASIDLMYGDIIRNLKNKQRR